MGRFRVSLRGAWQSWPVELTSPLTVEAAEAALRAAVTRRATWHIEDPVGRLSPRVVTGRVGSDGEIQLTAFGPSGRNSWRRTLRARLLSVPDGCVLAGTFPPSVFTQGFAVVWFVLAALVTVGAAAAGVRDAAVGDWSSAPSALGVMGAGAGMGLWGLVLMAIGVRFARRDAAFLRAWLANLLV